MQQVTWGYNIVADGWAGASNPHPHPSPNAEKLQKPMDQRMDGQSVLLSRQSTSKNVNDVDDHNDDDVEGKEKKMKKRKSQYKE